MTNPQDQPDGYRNNEYSDSTDSVLMIFEGGDYTVRPASPEMVEHLKRRREKEAELRKLMEEYYKQHPEKLPPTIGGENQAPSQPME